MAANLYKPRPTTSMLRAQGANPGDSNQNLRSLNPGALVMGRYTIQKVIGRGGMATVYLAKNQETERLVALKILDPEISNDPSYVERFRREARAAGRIRSDHVVAIYDLGTDESGTLVLVMEYLEGQTVQQALRNGRLPLQRAMILGRQLCEGLAAAHENGVIHRDLKPANLFIEKLTGGAEKLKVLDFGISKLAEASSQELTRAGQTLGTLAYMAPEQIRGAVKGNDPRLDLYSAGVSLFLMFTAKRPIDAEDTVQLLQAVLEKPPLTLAQAAGVEFPPAVEAFVAKALQKDPTRRYQSALEMRDALLHAAHEAQIDAIAHFSSPQGAAPAMTQPSRVNEPMHTPASGVATVMEPAPTFTPPSGVIVAGADPSAPVAPLTLPSFDDDDEEGKTEVRAPGGMQLTAPASPLPLAGRRPTGMNLPTLGPDGRVPDPSPPSPMRAPTMAPRGPGANNQPTLPPNRAQTLLGVPPAPDSHEAPVSPLGDSPPTQAVDIFGGPPPGFAPQPQVSGLPQPPVPTFGMAPPIEPQPVAPAPRKRSPMKAMLLGASALSLVLFSVAGYVVVSSRGTPANATQTAIRSHAPPVVTPPPVAPTPAQPAAPQAAQPAPQAAQPAAPTTPETQPAAPTTDPANVAQVLNPATPAPEAQPAAAAPEAQPAPAAQPAPEPQTAQAANTQTAEAPERPHRPHRATSATQPAAHTTTTAHAVTTTQTARPPRPPRVRRGPITEVPF